MVSTQQNSIVSVLCILLLLSTGTSTARRLPYAAVFPGFGGGNKGGDGKSKDDGDNNIVQTKNDIQQTERGIQSNNNNLKQPPPPPPPPGSKDITQTEGTAGDGVESTIITDTQGDGDLNSGVFLPPQQSQYWEEGVPFNQYGNLPPPPPGWIGPPPPNWNQQPGVMPYELEEWATREGYLLNEIQNLTATIYDLRQQEDMHLQQLDVLTERVMDAESDAASERNSVAEYRANYTELGKTADAMKVEIEELTEKCQLLTAKRKADEEKLNEMKANLKERSREVEELATVIETARVDLDREQYLAERSKKKKKRSFFAWLFGIGGGEDEDEEEEDRIQEFARTTLLRALQTERDSVHELESSLATLEQNNSAISEMVASRDMLIDELNNRVAVFEEDKVVLKAALRQLQKEMKDEAPKTQKLVDDLKDARQEIKSLRKMVDSVLSDHQTEVATLQNIITQKQSAINATESNMTVIGTYVDRLEDRLASFAIAKRDIENREEKCDEIEACIVKVESENNDLKEKINEFNTEHDELKALLKDLVDERLQLQNDNSDLTKERSSLIADGSALRETISSLEIDVDSLNKVISEWKLQVTDLENTIKNQALKLEASMEREKDLGCTIEQLNSDLEKERNRPPPPPRIVVREVVREVVKPAITDPNEVVNDKTYNETNIHNSTKQTFALSSTPEKEKETEEKLQIISPKIEDQLNETEVSMKISSPTMTTVEESTENVKPVLPRVIETRQNETLHPLQRPDLGINATMNTTTIPSRVPSLIKRTNTAFKRKVPFRRIRKAFSKMTGVHGAFTPPSRRQKQ